MRLDDRNYSIVDIEHDTDAIKDWRQLWQEDCKNYSMVDIEHDTGGTNAWRES